MAETKYYGVTPEAKERIKNKLAGYAPPECDKMKKARKQAEKVHAGLTAETAAEAENKNEE